MRCGAVRGGLRAGVGGSREMNLEYFVVVYHRRCITNILRMCFVAKIRRPFCRCLLCCCEFKQSRDGNTVARGGGGVPHATPAHLRIERVISPRFYDGMDLFCLW